MGTVISQISKMMLAGMFCAFPASAFAQDLIEPNERVLAAIDTGDIFTPTSDWFEGEAEAGCWVRREFAKGDHAIGLVLRRLQPGLPVQHVITGSRLRIRGGFEAGFMPGTGLSEIGRFDLNVFAEQDVVALVRMPFPPENTDGRSEQALASKASHYVLQGGRSDPVVIETGAIDGALAILENCAFRQLESFGVSPRERGSYSRGVSLANASEVGARLISGYGRVARQHSYQGPVGLRLIVDASGRLARCDVTTPFIRQPLRELACNTLAEHGEFEAALGADGRPVTDFMLQNIYFEIPPMPNADGTDPRRL